MTVLYTAFDKALAIVQQQNGRWKVDFHLANYHPTCVAIDPHHPQYLFCGTTDNGLWQSTDAGKTWERVGEGIIFDRVLSVAVSSIDQANGTGIIYAGTEPSAIFRSEDQGKSWQELETLRTLPSAPTWSFPPRPWTSHVRFIAPDPVVSGRVFAAIEAGALIRSLDGGQTWEDRKTDGPFDTHTLALPGRVPNRLYSAAGDGFMRPGSGFLQSDDGGETWTRPDEGLTYNYLWSVATDPVNPDTIVVSAAPGPRQAHNNQEAESAIYRSSNGSSWKQVTDGLPPAQGSLTAVLTSNEAEPGVFYAASNHGIFRSTDTGLSWSVLPIPWPANAQLGRAHAIVAVSA